jgi:hypothetical protein
MYVDTDKGEKSYVTLNNVTTVECHGGFSEDAKQWIVNALHILNDSVLSTFTLPPVDSKIAEILNKGIQQLDIDAYSRLEQIAGISYAYVSNVQHIFFD